MPTLPNPNVVHLQAQGVLAEWAGREYLVVGLALLTAALVATFVWLLSGLIGYLAAKTRGTLDDELTKRLAVPGAIAMGAIGAGLVLRTGADAFDPAFFDAAAKTVAVVAILGIAWGVVRTLRALFEQAGRRRPRLKPATLLGSRLTATALYAFAFLTILSELGISITPLLTALGIATLAVALALQDTLSNFFAGIWIQAERGLSPGHYVRLPGENVEGFVEQVGWRTTRIRLLAGNLVVLPNSRVAQATVIDHSLPTPVMSVVMQFKLPFDVDPQRAMTLLVEEAKEAARSTPGLLADPAPFANATPGIGDYGIGYSLIIKVREFTDQWNAQTAVTGRVWSRLQREGIQLLYPTRINLQADGNEFVPRAMARRPPQPITRAGPDPMQVEAAKAKVEIAAAQAAEKNAARDGEARMEQKPRDEPAPPSAMEKGDRET